METYEMIKLLREERGFSQGQLAEMVGYRDRSSIAKIESGKVDLSQSKIAAFAKALGVTPAYIMGWEGTQSASAVNDPYSALAQEMREKNIHPDDIRLAIDMIGRLQKPTP